MKFVLKLVTALVFVLFGTTQLFAQQGMGIGIPNPQEMLDVSGAIKLGTTTNTNAGTIRWTGTEFQGWDGTQWITFGGGGGVSGSLDDAYDNGSTITADVGTVAITGQDGIMVSGTYGSGLAVGATGGIAEGAGTRMFFNPRKAAFRAGSVDGTQWDDANIGYRSTAMGNNTKASGFASTAMGYNTTAPSHAETAIGRYNTIYTPASATTWNATDRLFVVGNGTGNSARSNAMVVLKNGNTGFGTSTPTSNVHIKNTGDASIWIEADSDNATESDNAYLKISQDGNLVKSIIGLSGANNTSPTGYAYYTDVLNNALLIGTETAHDLQFGTNNAVRMTIANTTGNVGIGTSTPTSNVHIKNTGDASIWIEADSDNATESDNAYIKITQDGNGVNSIIGLSGGDDLSPTGDTYTGVLSNALLVGTETASDLQFGTNNAVRMTIAKTTGRVGIGTTAPTTTLDVVGSVRIADGNQGVGKVLTSDANGLATWQTPAANTQAAFTTTGSVTSNAPGIYATDDFVFGAAQLADIAGINDNSRLFFDKSKSAFRAGYVNGTQWDDANIGIYSTAMGGGTTASGNYSTAMGYNTTALGHNSTAMGDGTTASGFVSTAMGDSTNASGGYSTAMGSTTTASGSKSTAMGANTTALSFVETAVGRYNTTYTPASVTGWVTTDRLFVVGNGTGNSARSDAMVVLKNGNTGFGTSTPSSDLHLKMSVSDFPNPTTGGITLEQSNSTAEWQIWNSAPFLSFARNNVRVAYVNNNSGAWTVTSDRRVKKDIEPMENVLSKVMQLNTVKYRYNHNEDDAIKTRGFIAQEVQEVFPDLVYSEDGSQLGIAPSDFGILSIKAIQEQQAQIEAQQKLINELMQRIQQLENR